MFRTLKIFLIAVVLFGCSDNLERTYHPNGQLSQVGERIDGKKEGEWIGFYENVAQQ